MTEPIVSQPVKKSRTSAGVILIWGGVGIVLLVLGLGLLNSTASQPQSGMAPDFTLDTYDGDTLTLSEMRGQVVIINFWASWCDPCAAETAALERVWLTYRDRDVMLIGVGYSDSDAQAREFIERYGVTYPTGADLGLTISDAYHVRGVPETFVVNHKGEVVFFYEGSLTFERLSAVVDQALVEAQSGG